MAKKKSSGMSPIGKLIILLVLFGVPCFFFLLSWGLDKLYAIAPIILVLIVLLILTVYTSYTIKLLYDYYELPAPVLRFVPCVCEVMMVDVKYHLPCYIMYGVAVVLGVLSQLPYSLLSVFGTDIATSVPFYFIIGSLLVLIAIQVIKGIGIVSGMKDIEEEWKGKTHVDLGIISKFAWCSFIPFVRIIAVYALNKPLSTMVSFMGMTSADEDEDNQFVAED